MTKEYDYLFKILLLDLGRKNILLRFSEDPFNTTFISTIGIDFKCRSYRIDGKIVKLQIWDTPGMVRFGSIRPSYYRGATGIMLIYDICNAKSFENIAGYHEEIKQHAPHGVEIMLLGNNCHKEAKRQVSNETGKRYAAEHGIQFMEVSARANINVEEALFTLAKTIKDTIKDTNEGATGSDEYVQEDGADEDRPGNACVVQ